MTVYVRERDGKTLKNMMIYDFSGGFNNATVMTADSGYVQLTGDNKYLLLTLFDGESFENIKQQRGGSKKQGNIPLPPRGVQKRRKYSSTSTPT